MCEDKRFIEVSFPVKEVSEESVREKNIRHGHISTLHIWWARRPLASSRATNYAALIPAPKDIDELNKKKNFIIELSKWENSLNEKVIEKARKDILEAFNGRRPRILDPFAGGGSIPLEALRLGCETYASDYNPVAVLILKCVLEYPQKYGRKENTLIEQNNNTNNNQKYDLVRDVKKWGEWVLKEVEKEIGRFYPKDDDGSMPIGYIWARTIKCQNPNCGAEIPLMRQFWLVRKKNKKVALYPYVENKEVKFKIVGTGYEPMPTNFNPSKGTVSKAIAVCPVCGTVIDGKNLRKQFIECIANQRMIAVILYNPKEKTKKYRVATKKDLDIYFRAKNYLEEKRKRLMNKWGFDPIPDEPTPEGKGRGAERAFSVRNYGLNKWGDLFNSRQKLVLVTLIEKIRLAYRKMLMEGLTEDYAKVIISFLALTSDKMIEKNSILCRWLSTSEQIVATFSRQALPIVWDYGESNILQTNFIDWILKTIRHLSKTSINYAYVNHSSATNLPYQDNYFDAVFTDPPYYDNVPYSYLSDFFYVWLKRSIGELYPELFSTPLTPKSKEIVAYTYNKSWKQAKVFFENMLRKAFQEIYRVLKPGGIAIIIYAHKTTEGWETVINALLESGLTVTASWPISTEMRARLRAMESAALASSIYIIARKLKKKNVGFYSEIKQELKKYLEEKLESLWGEGISGSDFFIAAIGSAIEVFGKYEKIFDYNGNVVKANRFLEDVRKIVTDFAVKRILHDGFAGEVSPLTRFYVLWRWNFQEAKAHFDEARKLAQSVGIDLEKEWNKGFIKKEKEFIRVLGPHQRDLKNIEKSTELIDVLHYVLRLWEKGDREKIKEVLITTGYGKSDVFYRVAQAISETLPKDSKEKKLLDGFLSGKERIKNDLSRERFSSSLEDYFR